jgi:hypothetical protein
MLRCHADVRTCQQTHTARSLAVRFYILAQQMEFTVHSNTDGYHYTPKYRGLHQTLRRGEDRYKSEIYN